nr:hypothetical protein [Tanacetum cinerariifolium]
QQLLGDAEAADACAGGLGEELEEGDDLFAEQLGLARVAEALWGVCDELGVEVVCGHEEQFDVDDELFGGHDAVDVGAVADVQQHVGDARGRL